MDLVTNWQEIRNHFNRSFSSNFHVSIASVDGKGHPTVTPIGSLFLNRDMTGFYFEKYPSKLPKHAQENKNICILAVNSGNWFWIKSLFKGEFGQPPALKLYGELSKRRVATAQEMSRFKKRVRLTSAFKGNTYLWGDMNEVREITFSRVEMINLGKMTGDLQRIH